MAVGTTHKKNSATSDTGDDWS